MLYNLYLELCGWVQQTNIVIPFQVQTWVPNNLIIVEP